MSGLTQGRKNNILSGVKGVKSLVSGVKEVRKTVSGVKEEGLTVSGVTILVILFY